MRKHAFLFLIVLIYLGIGALYVINTPAWQAPDEPAHYNYVRQLAAGRLPVIEAGDYDQEYLTEVVFVSGFAPQYPLDVIEYEDWQPPLYYLLQTPGYKLSNGSLLIMRLFSLLLGAGIIILAYAIVLRLAPEEHWLALTTAVFVAFLPQHIAILASANNDALAELIIAAILYLLVLIGQSTAIRTWEYLILGILLGLGYLTKGTVYPITAVVGLVLLWRFWGEWRQLIRTGFLVFVPAFLLGAVWWGRNIAVYGGLDILGKTAHDSVVIGQPRTAEWIALYGLLGTVDRFVQTTFNSFWGQFGWMTVPMTYPSWLYPLLWLFTGLALAGLIAAAIQQRKSLRKHLLPLLILLSLLLLTLGVHLGYNLTFVQHQGRYLFPALIPIALGLAVGLGLWAQPLRKRWPNSVYLIPVGLAAALIALDLYALFRVIIPALA
jgi:4-amino-4-deoxy-L-arabinose transferase-like glycosyltransferase